jgi:uncharacterized protein YndB with AHSA1/START domain
MRLHHVHIAHTFAQPVDRIFEFLSEHENLQLLFGVPVRRVRSGDGHPNGVGSRRRIGPSGPLGFEETVTEFVPGELITYRITGGSPLRGHRGTMSFAATADGGTALDYRIQLGSWVPGVAGLIKRILQRSIPAGLQQVDSMCEQGVKV